MAWFASSDDWIVFILGPARAPPVGGGGDGVPRPLANSLFSLNWDLHQSLPLSISCSHHSQSILLIWRHVVLLCFPNIITGG